MIVSRMHSSSSGQRRYAIQPHVLECHTILQTYMDAGQKGEFEALIIYYIESLSYAMFRLHAYISD